MNEYPGKSNSVNNYVVMLAKNSHTCLIKLTAIVLLLPWLSLMSQLSVSGITVSCGCSEDTSSVGLVVGITVAVVVVIIIIVVVVVVVVILRRRRSCSSRFHITLLYVLLIFLIY